MNASRRVALYCRVSTATQTTENQRIDLERVAAARGWHIVAQFSDDGISGAKDRSERPALNALIKAATRGEFDLLSVLLCESPDEVDAALATTPGLNFH